MSDRRERKGVRNLFRRMARASRMLPRILSPAADMAHRSARVALDQPGQLPHDCLPLGPRQIGLLAPGGPRTLVLALCASSPKHRSRRRSRTRGARRLRRSQILDRRPDRCRCWPWPAEGRTCLRRPARPMGGGRASRRARGLVRRHLAGRTRHDASFPSTRERAVGHHFDSTLTQSSRISPRRSLELVPPSML